MHMVMLVVRSLIVLNRGIAGNKRADIGGRGKECLDRQTCI